VRSTVRFFVVNPTNISYDFVWECEDEAGALQPFRCVNRRGTIAGGKKAEMIFEFTPEQMTTLV